MQPFTDSFAPMNRIVAMGSGTTVSEARILLRDRLRACLMVLGAGYLVILTQWVLLSKQRPIFIGYVALFGGLIAAAAFLLFRRGHDSIRRLRQIEAMLIVGIAVYTALDLYSMSCAVVRDPEADAWRLAAFFKSDLAYVTAAIFVYAIFIPNDWRRALGMILTLAAAPLVAAAALYATNPEFRRLVSADPALSYQNLGEHVALVCVSAAAAVFGVRTINGYRSEIARQRELNEYRLGPKLGTGGMGEVYLAEHSMLKRRCALKIITPKLTSSDTSRARFELEVRATARLSHWNTVDVYDYGRTETGEFFYVMEYLPGLSLQELVDRHGPLPAPRVIYLLRQVCEALREAHLSHLIHRDLKPPNIFAAYRGARYDVVKVLDFGLVKSVAGDAKPLTLEGVVTGSPLYMAPELILRHQVPDGRADIYSLAAVAYFLLTGRPPFVGPDGVAVMMAHVHDQPVPMSQHQPGVPPDLEEIILRGMEKRPDDRFSTVTEFSMALAACGDARGWSADRAEAWWLAHAPIDVPPQPVDDASTVDQGPTLVREDFPGVDPLDAREPLDPLLTFGEDPRPPAG